MATFFLIGFFGLLLFAFLLYKFYSITFIAVAEQTDCFIISHGRVEQIFKNPGLQFVPQNLWPWVQILHISKSLQCLNLKEIQTNDRHGTSLNIDLWVEFRIADPYKALFHVDDWNSTLKSVVIHSAISILSSLEFVEILRQRSQLETLLQTELCHETERWGLVIEGAMIQNVSLLPEISQQLFDLVAARIDKSKALIEEQGRLAVSELEARTDLEISRLKAEAEAQQLNELHHFYSELSTKPAVAAAFQQYLLIKQTDPGHLVTFGCKSPMGLQGMVDTTQMIETLSYQN